MCANDLQKYQDAFAEARDQYLKDYLRVYGHEAASVARSSSKPTATADEA